MDQLAKDLRAMLGSDAVLVEPDQLLVYECDGLPQHKYLPRAVVFPSSTEETAEVMRLLARAGVPFTPRGAGTGLSGGALALSQGVVIELARMRKVLRIDEANRIAVVQTGVVNLHVSRAVAHLGLHYVPDPSSQPTCTIGGNLAENAGGIHCLKYGTTTDHVLGARVVLAGGEVVDLGGAGREQVGYDLLGVFIGSEGTFGIATEATLRLVPIPPAVRTLLAEFPEVNDASHAVSAIIAAGVMPAALEMMDREIIRAVEASVFAAGLPLDAGAALLIELDGIEAGLDDEAERVTAICLKHGARDCRRARDENERKKLWAARKGAFGAIGRISPDSMIQDAVVPRSRLPEVLEAAYRIASKYQLRIANVFHAGDGNLHPLICFDSRSIDEVGRVKEAGRELMETCVRAGGSITGEHGVGFDKRELLSLIFSEDDMDAMLRVRAAFDPTGLCNPGKIIPMLRGCGEARAVSLGARAPHLLLRDEAAQKEILNDRPERQGLSAMSGDNAAMRLAGTIASPSSSSNFDRNVLQQQLAGIVGAANIRPSPLPHSRGTLTVTPETEAEVCQIVKLASSAGWTIVPAGAAKWLDAGNAMERVNLIVSTQRLKRIIEHEPADLVAVTQAGVTLQDLNAELARNGQWLPLDPPDDGQATVGGVVATGLGGAQQFGYGAPRRHVIGMKVVMADGSLIKVGGRVVKNVAGYDLCKLFTGSYGTLGLIIEVNFKLRPLPFQTRTVQAWSSRERLLSAAAKIISAPLFPVAIELVSPQLVGAGLIPARFLTSGQGQALPLQILTRESGLGNGSDHLLLVRFAGSADAVANQTRTAIKLIDSHTQTHLAADDSAIWQSLAALPLRFSQDVVWRVGLRPDDVAMFLSSLDKTYAGDDRCESMWQAGVGDGRIRVLDRSKQNGNQCIARLETMRSEAQNLGGSLTVENAPAEIRDSVDAWGNLGTSASLMQGVKQQLDPNNVFSPGRFGF